MADVVTIPSHLSIPEVRTYMTVEAARDVSAPDTPPSTAVDEHGRSAQTFLVDVVVRSGGTERRAVASGQDIYAVTAPLAVEAVHRILTGQTQDGRRRLRWRDLRRTRLPPHAVLAHLPGTASVTGGPPRCVPGCCDYGESSSLEQLPPNGLGESHSDTCQLADQPVPADDLGLPRVQITGHHKSP